MQGSNSRTVYPKFSYKHRTHSEGQSGVTNRAQHNTPQQRTNGKGVSMACEPKRCSHSNRGRHHHDFRDHQADKGQEPCQLRKVTNHSSGPRNSKPCCRTVQRTLHTNASLSLNMGEWNAASWCRGVSSAKKKCSKRNSSDKSLHPAKQQRKLLHFWGHEPVLGAETGRNVRVCCHHRLRTAIGAHWTQDCVQLPKLVADRPWRARVRLQAAPFRNGMNHL
jgi:hypothetical protein